jgi:hypothetical protein
VRSSIKRSGFKTILEPILKVCDPPKSPLISGILLNIIKLLIANCSLLIAARFRLFQFVVVILM